MNYQQEIYIRIAWMASSACFACYGETKDANLLEPAELRKVLFAWHEGSRYGLDLEKTAKQDGLMLSPYLAIDYLAEPRPLLHSRLAWENGAAMLQKLAGLLREALAKQWYKPSFARWREGGTGWLLHLPESRVHILNGLLAGSRGMERDFLDQWFDLAMKEWLLTPEGRPAALAWKERAEAHAELMMGLMKSRDDEDAYSWMQEEDWLAAIGWQEEAVPFRVCLQLVEPYAETYVDGSTAAKDDASDWRLRFIVQDKGNPDRFVETSPSGTRLHAQQLIPEAWVHEFQDRIQEQIAKIIRISPELASKDQRGKLREQLSDDEAWTFLTETSFRLVGAGISLFLPTWWDEVQRQKPQLKAKLKGSAGASSSSRPLLGMEQLLAYDWRVSLGRVVVSEQEFRTLAEQKKRLIYLRGKWVQLDPASVEQVKTAMRQMEKKKGFSLREVLDMHLQEGLEIEEAEQPAARRDGVPFQVRVELNRHMQAMMKQLRKVKTIPLIGAIAGLQAELRPYQREGVSWLLFLRQLGLGGCLADDMGLGKTLQYVAYLLGARGDSLEGRKPSLLVCPTSVLGNWQKELERFAPSLRIYLHYGPQRLKGEALAAAMQGVDLVLTSYTLAQTDGEDLAQLDWDSLCLDEAQNIKNAATKQAVAIRTFQAQHRIALTGTPMENRLTELWSIMDWLNPGYLGSRSHFVQHYVGPIEKGGDGAAALAERVKRMVRPFLLRRVKKDPAIRLELPEKSEVKAYVALTPEQGALYENVVQRLMARLDSDVQGIEKKGLILSALTKLKMICDHPALFLKEEMGGAVRAARSAKLARLVEMLDELRREDEDEGVLIFTQFVGMGALLQAALQRELGEPVLFLHGGLGKAQRDELVARFQDGALPAGERPRIFVLSLKAGGTGLNLTAANHVFHFDRWWNPAVENQATDRAFRIGQTRDVQVHKFVALGTLEERIDEMIARKQGLSEQIVGSGSGESWITELSTGELRELFALRREWVEK